MIEFSLAGLEFNGGIYLSCFHIYRTPAGSVSPSEESDHFEKNHCFSNGDCYQSLDGNVEFNMSYHKATLTSNEDLYHGTTQISELHGVPGFSFVFDEDTPLQKTEDDIPFLQVTDDDNLNMDFSAGMMKGKHLKKTISQPLNGIADGQAFGNYLKPEKVYRRCGSLPNGFVTVSDISLRTQPSQLPPPSRPPPAADVRSGSSGRSTPNGNSVASEGSAGDSSPPFFDVEVDASSSAAASAAAMKEAMVKAKAKLRSAKEFMDRKKEGFQGSAKMGSKNHDIDKVEKVSKIVDECNSLRGEGLQSSCDIEDNGIEFSVREERQKVIKTAQEVSVSTGGKPQKVAKKSTEKKHGKESLSSLGSDKIDGGSEWKEESQFFELVRTDTSDKALETNHVQTSVHNTKIHERGQKDKMAVMGVFEQQEGDIRKVKSARGNNELEYEKKSKVVHQACEGEENKGRSKAAKEVHRQKGHVKKERVAQEVSEQVENVKKVRITQKPLESEKKSTGVDILENCNNLVEVQQKEYAFEVEQAMKHKENNEQQLKEDKKRRESEKRLKESCEREDTEKIRSEAFGWEEIEEGLKEVPEQSNHAKILKEAHEQKESEKRLKEVIERDEIEKKQKEACIRQEDEKRLKEALEQEERKKRLQRVLEQEEHEKRLKKALEREEDEKKQKELHKGEENEKRLDEGLEREESEKKQEACEIEENEKRLTDACEKEDEKSLCGASEQVVNSDKLEGAQESRGHDGRSKKGFEQEESKKEPKEASTCEETGKRLKDAGGKEELKGLNIVHEQSEGDGYRKAPKLAKGICVHMDGEDLGVSDGAQKQEDNDNLQAPKLACTNDKHNGKLEETQEALAQEENGKKKSELKNKEKDSEMVETANVLVGEKSNQFRTEDSKKSPHLDDGVKKAGEPGVGVKQTHIFKSKSLSQLDSDPINKERKFSHELGDRGNNTKQTQAVLNQEESKEAVMSTHVIKDGIENGRKIEAARPDMVEIKGNFQKPAVRVNASQTTERKEKDLNESLKSEDKETERMKRERELEMERIRKIEEEREREREREKDRMAIDRATLEAREKAYSEARERADRAAVERAMAEARERLEKACAEAREKSFVEKASMEARLRVERAAVERATAEARERAVGKAIADKASFETRERVGRSVSDKYLASFRSNEMKQSSSVYGGMRSSIYLLQLSCQL